MALTEIEHAARKYCIEHRQYTNGGRGRTDGPTYACWHTPVDVLPNSDDAPCVTGLGYWKTGFSNGKGFAKTLYTASTFRIEVGEDWMPL